MLKAWLNTGETMEGKLGKIPFQVIIKKSWNTETLCIFQISFEAEYQRLSVTVVECHDFANMDTFGKSDPFVEVLFVPGKHVQMKTKVIRNNLDPVFDNEVFKREVSQ